MGYSVKHFGSTAVINLTKSAVDIQATSLGVEGSVQFEIYFLDRKKTDLVEPVIAEAVKLAQNLKIAAPILVPSASQLFPIKLTWVTEPLTREQILVELAKLFESKEFAKALDQRE